jgi:xanthine/uracil/vitamin C permease (AzgA family)
MAVEPSSQRSLVSRDGPYISAGVALFLSTVYVLKINADILGEAGLSKPGVFTGTLLMFLVMALGSALWARVGLVIAPSIGVSLFLVEFDRTTKATADQLIWSLLFTGVLFAIFSFSRGWRQKVIDALPTPVKTGLASALATLFFLQGQHVLQQEGAQLVPALNEMGRYMAASGIDVGVALATIATVVMLLFFSIRQIEAMNSWIGRRSAPFRILFHAEFIYAIAIVIAGLYWIAPEYLASRDFSIELAWVHASGGAAAGGAADAGSAAADEILLAGIFALAVFFMLATDIIGTPDQIIPAGTEIDGRQAPEGAERSFQVDSVGTLLAAPLGTSAPIHYAENKVLSSFGCYGPKVAWVIFVLYAGVLALAVGSWLGFVPSNIGPYFPPMATVPILWFISLLIMYVAIRTGKPAEAPDEAEGDQRFLFAAMPALTAAFLTRFSGLEFAFVGAILTAYLVGAVTGAREFREAKGFRWIALAALVFLALRLIMMFFGAR